MVAQLLKKSMSFSKTRRFQQQFYAKFSHFLLPARTVFKLPGSFRDNAFFSDRLEQSPVVKTHSGYHSRNKI
jgi:hypothetical protein